MSPTCRAATAKLVFVALSGGLVVAGCESEPPPPAPIRPKASKKPVPKRPAPKVTMGVLGHTFTYRHSYLKTKGSVSASLYRRDLYYTVSGLIPRTALTIGKRRIVLRSRLRTVSTGGKLKGQGARYIGKILLSELGKPALSVKVAIPVIVEMPGYEPISFTLEKLQTSYVGEVFAAVTRGPVLLPGEDAKPHGNAAIIIKYQHHHMALVRGPTGGTFADIRFVALVTKTQVRGSRRCSYRRFTGGGKSIEVTRADATFAIYDRFSGTKVAEKTFAAPRGCPQSMMVNRKTRGVYSYPRLATVIRWAKRAAR